MPLDYIAWRQAGVESKSRRLLFHAMKNIILSVCFLVFSISSALAVGIEYVGSTLKYPKNITKKELLKEIPDFSCTAIDKSTEACSATVTLLQEILIVGYEPIVCRINGGATFFFSGGSVSSFSCDVTNQTWSDLLFLFKGKYGNPKVEQTKVGTIKSATYEWVDGKDLVQLLLVGGENVYGKPFLTTRIVLAPANRKSRKSDF